MPGRGWLVGAGALATALLLTSCTGEEPARSSAKPTRRVDTRPGRGPSQSSEDAKRDGVVPEVAALRFDQRVVAISTVRLDDQVWVISRLGDTSGTSVDCDGPQEGTYGIDWVCGSEYGELLLLNRRGTKILRALPLPGLPPQYIAVTDDAAYCGRAGDGGLPDSMVCRMDAQTFKTTVRVFWDKANRAQPPKPQLLPGWKLHEEYLEMYKFQADETGIWAQHYDRRVWTKLDPITLEVVDDKAVRS